MPSSTTLRNVCLLLLPLLAIAQDAAHAAHVKHKASHGGSGENSALDGAIGALAGGGKNIGPSPKEYVFLIGSLIGFMDLVCIYQIWTAKYNAGKIGTKIGWTVFIIAIPIFSIICHCINSDSNPEYEEIGMSAQEKAECDEIVRKHQEKLRAQAASREKPKALDELV